MGWYNGKDGSYYQQHVEVEGCSNKITEGQRVFNKLGLTEIREGIDVAQQQYMRDMRDMRDVSSVHLKTPYSKTKKEPIEYVVKESKGKDTDFKETVKVSKEDIIDFNTKRKEKEIINFEEKRQERQNEEENYRGA